MKQLHICLTLAVFGLTLGSQAAPPNHASGGGGHAGGGHGGQGGQSGAGGVPAPNPDDPTGIIVLNAQQKGALSLSGTAQAFVPQVRVNSSDTQSIAGTGNAVLESPSVKTVGGAHFGGTAMCTSAVATSSSAASDPLATLATPTWQGMADLGSRSFNADATVEPGLYSGGIKISGGTVVFNPGLYILDGNGLDATSSSAHVHAEGVTLYFRGKSKLSITGGASMHLTPPDSGAYDGVAVFVGRSNSSTISLSGGSGIDVSGILYLPAAHLSISGGAQAATEGPIVGGFVIADSVDVGGSGRILVGTKPVLPTPEMAFD